jgi:hypothetical protein
MRPQSSSRDSAEPGGKTATNERHVQQHQHPKRNGTINAGQSRRTGMTNPTRSQSPGDIYAEENCQTPANESDRNDPQRVQHLD